MADTTSSNTSENSSDHDHIDDAEVLEEKTESDQPEVVELDSEDLIDEAQPEVEAPPVQEATIPQKRGFWGSALGLIVGGAIAAVLGFIAATQFFQDQNTAETSVALLTDQVSDQATQLDAVSESLVGVSKRIDAFAEIQPAETDLSPLLTKLEELTAQLTVIETRLDDLEARPLIEVGADGSTAMEAQLESFRRDLDRVTESAKAEIAAAQARASAVEAEAAEMARSADLNTALAELKSALDSGLPFKALLPRLGEVPVQLSVASDGVATLTELQKSFPDAARNVLAAVQTVPEEASTTERLVAFLRRQTNARSLSPKDGDGADAVLSRAEAALASGNLTTAVKELQSLSESTLSAMGAWMSDAETRAAAIAAFADISASN